MARKPVTFEDVREIALSLPGVEEGLAYGVAAFKVKGKVMACRPAHRSAEADSLMVRVGFEDRAEMLETAPEVYYVTDHYAGYTSVLVRLARIDKSVLRDLLAMAHKFVSHEKRQR